MISLVTAQVPALLTHVYYMYIKYISFYPYSSDTLGARSKSTDKFNDNYTCIHWTKSVYNIHNEIKLKWYTKNADQTYNFFQTLESIYLTLEVFSYLPSCGRNFFFFCVPLCVIATFTLF